MTLAVGAGLAACGGGDGEEALGTTTTVSERSRINNYCAKVLALETFPTPELDEDTTEDEQKETAREAAREALPLAQEAADAAPAEIRADVDTLLDARKRLAKTGDLEVFEEPAVTAAEERAHALDLRNCRWGRAEVRAVEYAFQGMPETFRRRPTSFDLSNEGSEAHELVVLKIRAEVQEPAAEILLGEEADTRERVTQAGRAFASPGKTSYEVVDLQAGRYVIACFLPVAGGEEAPPHVARGMFAEFTVD